MVTDMMADDLTNVSIWLMTEQNLVIIVGCVPVWRSLFTRNTRKQLDFGSLLSKYFPPRPQTRNSGSDLEALHGIHKGDVVSKAQSNELNQVDRLGLPPGPVELVRKDSIGLPSLDMIGKPSKRNGSV